MKLDGEEQLYVLDKVIDITGPNMLALGELGGGGLIR